MSDPIISANAFKWVLTVLSALGTMWVLLDIVYVTRLRGKDFSDPVNRDKRFGYTVGIFIGVFTTVGMLRFHGVM